MTQQTIDFENYDEIVPSLIHSRNVIVNPSSSTRDVSFKTSNKITTQNVVDYSWEDRYTIGQLVSYNANMKLVAYVLSISNNFMIRVLNEENSSRCLIKDFSAEVTDISFSRSKSPYIASIDVNGSVKVNKVIIGENMLECRLVLHIMGNPSRFPVLSKVCHSRILWCCNGDADDAADSDLKLILSIVHGDTFEALQVDTIESELSLKGEGYDKKVDRPGLKMISKQFQDRYTDGPCLAGLYLPYLCYTVHKKDTWITSFAVSNDAAAFAVALQDGSVNFFTLDGSASSGLKKAYSWRPFVDDAVWSLLFLDDCRAGHWTESLWSHVVVGAAFNRQLKVFRCDKWQCLQTVTFDAPTSPCRLSVQLDSSARFLMLSDVGRKVLYLLEIDSADAGVTRMFKSVQEFLLGQPVLSFDVKSVLCRPTSNGGQRVDLKLFTITSSAFQKMRVTYTSLGDRLREILVDDDEGCVAEEWYYGEEDEDYDEDGLWGKEDVKKRKEEDARMDDEYHHHNTSKGTLYRWSGDVAGGALGRPTVSLAMDVGTVAGLPSVDSKYQDPAIVEVVLQDVYRNDIMTEGPETLQTRHSDTETGEFDDELVAKDTTDSAVEGLHEEVPESSPLSVCLCETLCGESGRASLANSSSSDVEECASLSSQLPMSRVLDMMRLQACQLDVLAGEMHERVRCDCARDQQTWVGLASNDVLEECQRALSLQAGLCAREAVEAIVPRITNDVGDHFVKHVCDCVSSAMLAISEFSDVLLRDETFVDSLVAAVSQSSETRLQDVYRDAARKNIEPDACRTVDKLVPEARDSLRLGARGVVSASDRATRSLEERLASLYAGHLAAILVNVEEHSGEIQRQVVGLRVCVTEATEAFSSHMQSVTDVMQTVRVATGDHVSGRTSVAALSNGFHAALRAQNIDRLIAEGNFVGAIDEALSLTNLTILLSACSRIRSKSVLSSSQRTPSLSCSSILVLIQQLSHDFSVQSDLKIEYLFDALLSLDTEDPTICDHLSTVMRGVTRRLQKYLDQGVDVENKEKISFLLRLTSSRID